MRARWAIAGAVRSTATRALDLRGRLRRRPSSSRRLAQPRPLRAGEEPLRLTHALIGCDLNPDYVDYWPLVRRAWKEVVGLEPLLVLVAEPGGVPAELATDANVHVFPPVDGLHTAFQAQCIRLFYPALLETDGAVVISDADMVPLSRRYFERPAAQIPSKHFLAYRNAHMEAGEIPVCYNAALPRTWGDVFDVRTMADVRDRLATLADGRDYAGTRGGSGWTTDQRLLFEALRRHAGAAHDVWVLDDHYTRHRRLERGLLRGKAELPADELARVRRGVYADFHCPPPRGPFRDLIESVIDLAVAGGPA